MKKEEIEIINSGGIKISLDSLTFGEGAPKTLILSGVHGSERSGSLVIAELIRDLPDFEGTLTVVPYANPLGYVMGSRLEPLSNYNLNRQFKEKPADSPALKIVEKLAELASGYDYIIDLHSFSTAGLIQIKLSGTVDSQRLAERIGPDVVRDYYSEKSLTLGGTFSNWARAKNLNYVLVELPYHKGIKKNQYMQVVSGIKRHLQGEDPENSLDAKPKVKIRLVKAPETGVFFPSDDFLLSSSVEKGDKLGVLQELAKGKVVDIFSDYSGIVCERDREAVPVVAGKTIVAIGELD